MKYKFLIPITFFLANVAFAQVAIGKNQVSTSSTSLEFGNGNKGIVLPWVTSTTDVESKGVVSGTLVFDTSDKKIKVKDNTGWQDLTVDTSGQVDTILQDNAEEKEAAKVVIGKKGATDSTPGLLVLSDDDKAMILPKVESPHLNIINPAAGMIVYDTLSKQVAAYNGSVWSFWKP